MSMNGSGENTLHENSGTPEAKSCSIITVIPTLGMSSCRGRAEAFARSLSSKLRTLGSQSDDGSLSPEEESIINDNATANTWRTTNDSEQTVTDLQPLRHESDSFFDFDCELESPGSPVDECEYLRLIETASNTPHNSAAESGYICASTSSSRGSTDLPYSEEHIEHKDTTDGPGCAPTLHNGYDTDEHIHDNHDDASSITSKSLEDSEDIADTNEEQQNDASSITNKNLENVEDTTNVNTEQQDILAEPQKADENLTPVDLANIQDEIINELQVHSARIGTLIASIQTQANIEIQTDTENIHSNLSNGKTENETLANENLENIPNQTHKLTTDDKKTETTAQNNEVQIGLDANESARTSSQEILNDTNKIKNKTNEGEKSSFGGHDDDEDDCRPQRVRRCSSLKTGKTPPGTPGRKKIVRFADVLGLDLADIKTFLDEIPTIPKSAFEDLEVLESEPPIQLGPKSDKLLVPLFQQPGGLSNFLDLVRQKQVSLENAAVTDHINQTITGTVRVRNLDFNKSVHIRYSLDNWRSYADLQANYVENSCDGFSDKFSFYLFGNSLRIGQRIEFAVRFQCKGQQFWDSNYGTNYCFQCLPASTNTGTISQSIHVPATHTNHTSGLFSPNVGDAWCSSFY